MKTNRGTTSTLFIAGLILAGAWAFGRFGIIQPTLGTVAASTTSLGARLPQSVSNLPFLGSLPISEPAPPRAPIRVEGILDIILEVDAAYAVTGRGEVLFDLNGGEVLPIASITKVLTALTAIDALPLDAPIKITQEAIATEGNLGGLYVNETFSLYDALIAMLLPSSNDAAVAIAQATGNMGTFVSSMNQKAQSIGIEDTTIFNVHGLSPPGNMSSAKGVATFMHEALRNKDLASILRQPVVTVESLDGIAHTFVHRGNGLTAFPGVMGLKTGYTDESRGTLVFAFRPDTTSDRVVVTVILGSDDRSTDTEALATWVRDAYTWPLATTIEAL